MQSRAYRSENNHLLSTIAYHRFFGSSSDTSNLPITKVDVLIPGKIPSGLFRLVVVRPYLVSVVQRQEGFGLFFF